MKWQGAGSFVVWMLVASSLGFVKVLALAQILPAAGFGDYLVYFGAATMASMLVSLGIVERTTKLYPRRWVDGDAAWVERDALAVARTLLKRLGLIGLAGALIAAPVFGSLAALDVVGAAALAAVTALLGLNASVYRAIGSKEALQSFQMHRSLAVLVLALVGSWQFGWRGALAGDVFGSVVVVVWSAAQLRLMIREAAPPVDVTPRVADDRESGHHELYVANVLTSSMQMVDRSVVRVASGAAVAGSYGFAMLVPQVAQLTVNVVVQYIGPLVIKFVHTKHRDQSRISQLRLQAMVLAGFAGVMVAGALIAKRLPFSGDLIAKFGISDTAFLLAGALAACQIASVIEFHLIARDRERQVLNASIMATGLFVVGYGAVALARGPIEWYLATAVAARVVQVLLLRGYYVAARGEGLSPG